MIDWRAVEKHADEAESRRYKVWRLKYTNTAHVYHMFQDREKYWDSITGIWDADYLSKPGKIKVAL